MPAKTDARPIHPGEVLRDRYLVPLVVSANQLALAMGISTNRITEILRGRRNVSADTALRLERALGTPAEQWLRLQSIYELRTAEIEEAESLKKVRRITTVEAAEVKEARGAPKAKRPAKKRRAKKAAKKVRRSR